MKEALEQEYKTRLRRRPIREEYRILEKQQILDFRMKYNIAHEVESEEIDIKEMEKVTKKLNIKKAKDMFGLHNILFLDKNCSRNIKNAYKTCFNKIKRQNKWPSKLRKARITTIPKPGSA